MPQWRACVLQLRPDTAKYFFFKWVVEKNKNKMGGREGSWWASLCLRTNNSSGILACSTNPPIILKKKKMTGHHLEEAGAGRETWSGVLVDLRVCKKEGRHRYYCCRVLILQPPQRASMCTVAEGSSPQNFRKLTTYITGHKCWGAASTLSNGV